MQVTGLQQAASAELQTCSGKGGLAGDGVQAPNASQNSSVQASHSSRPSSRPSPQVGHFSERE
ncbi:MAG: hypothetical protein ABR587_04320, partial [Candidatus Binatia bacterium]